MILLRAAAFSLLAMLALALPVAAATPQLNATRGAHPEHLVSVFQPRGAWPYAITFMASRYDSAAELRVVYRPPYDLTGQKDSSGNGVLRFQEWRPVNGHYVMTAERRVSYRALAHGPVKLCSRAAGLCVDSDHINITSTQARIVWTQATDHVPYAITGHYRATSADRWHWLDLFLVKPR